MKPTSRPILRGLRTAAAAVTVPLIAGCTTGLESLPLSAPGATAASYSLTAVFSNALNLPTKAKVKLNGADIGEVGAVRAQNFTAYVTLQIRSDIPLRVGSTAELRSATPLGDVFVAVRPKPNMGADTPLLREGDTIALNLTTAAATIEDVLSSAALLVNGGAIRQLTSIVNGAGSAVGGRGTAIATLLQRSNTLISRLNGRSTQIKTALQSTSDLAATISAHQNTLNDAITASGPAMGVISSNTTQLIGLVDAVARITAQLSRFPSLQGTDTRSLIADINQLSAQFNTIVADPNISMTAINQLIGILMKFTNSTAAHANLEVPQLAIGAWPDMNFPGDPALHMPDGTDWHTMIGSLRYEWNLLSSKVLGPGR